MGIYFPQNTNNVLTGFADAGYLSNPDDAKSQTNYVFLQGTTVVFWKSSKQTLTTTSSNHVEIITLYKACKEYSWLRKLINHINIHIDKQPLTNPTTIYEDNRPYVNQIAQGFIKGDRIKHIAPKKIYTHELHGDTIQVKWIPNIDNKADLFTKLLPSALYKDHSYGIGLQRLSNLLSSTQP